MILKNSKKGGITQCCQNLIYSVGNFTEKEADVSFRIYVHSVNGKVLEK